MKIVIVFFFFCFSCSHLQRQKMTSFLIQTQDRSDLIGENSKKTKWIKAKKFFYSGKNFINKNEFQEKYEFLFLSKSEDNCLDFVEVFYVLKKKNYQKKFCLEKHPELYFLIKN